MQDGSMEDTYDVYKTITHPRSFWKEIFLTRGIRASKVSSAWNMYLLIENLG